MEVFTTYPKNTESALGMEPIYNSSIWEAEGRDRDSSPRAVQVAQQGEHFACEHSPVT